MKKLTLLAALILAATSTAWAADTKKKADDNTIVAVYGERICYQATCMVRVETVGTRRKGDGTKFYVREEDIPEELLNK
jgi:hypothetical protein